MYEIKDQNGNVKFQTTDANTALAYYYNVRNESGYAEAWYNGECFFKTR